MRRLHPPPMKDKERPDSGIDRGRSRRPGVLGGAEPRQRAPDHLEPKFRQSGSEGNSEVRGPAVPTRSEVKAADALRSAEELMAAAGEDCGSSVKIHTSSVKSYI